MNNQENRVYFEGLDSLRAIGALSVLFGHIELSKKTAGISNLMDVAFYKHTSGHLGVILFFVLSGFLITFLLLKEKEKHNNIYVLKFYTRRALRIWPIYYLIVFTLLFLFPFVIHFEYFAKPHWDSFSNNMPTLFIYFFMMPNLVSFGILGIGGGYHLASIGTEEQFYILWPWIVKLFKNIVTPLLLILVIIPLLPHFCDYFAAHFFTSDEKGFLFLKQIKEFFMYFKINCMALGGLFAFVYYKNINILLTIIYNKFAQGFALVVGFGGWLLGFHLPYFNDEFYAFLFAIIIMNTATNPQKLLSFNYSITNYLGKISYGIFVYHWIVIYLIMDWIMPLKGNSTLYNTLLYTGSGTATVLVSHLSFFYFEQWFLKFKDRFAIVKSNKPL